MGLGTPPQPAFGEAVSSESTSQSSDCEPLKTSDAVHEMPSAVQRVPSQPDLLTCHAEILTGPLVGDPSELAILFNDGTFKCPLCPTSKVFTNTTKYRSHRNKFHNLPGYTCVVCSFQFESLDLLVAHMLEQKHSIKCPVPSCRHDFYRPSEAASHYTRKHRAFLCVHCGLPQNGTICYKIHVKTHHSTEGIDYVPASSLVEATLNTSFHDPLSDDQEEQDIQSDTTRDIDSDSVIAEEDMQPVPEPFTIEIDTDSGITVEHVQPVSELEPGTEDSDGDSVVHLLKNPFHEENVVFGPGAEELLNGPQTPSTSRQDDVLWVGHDVSLYQSMSEKHKKIYRYNCGKCSCSFRNKDMFKRHARVHEHICKYCFKKFDSLEDFQSHKKTHSSSKKTLVCQICAHKPTGLKDFMVHEMRHRLNSSFQRKFKEFLKRSPAHKGDFHKCTKCQKLTKGISLGIKHEVWHEWTHLWTTYVTGRIFSETFKEKDAIGLERAVEKRLKAQWRDQRTTALLEPDISPSEDLDSVVDEMVDDVVDDVVVNEIDHPLSTKDIHTDNEHESTDDENELFDKESESDTESDYSGEGVKLAVDGWMNFWQSYLGLNDTPPKWVMPILRQLRSKWKQYHMEEQDSLFKQMDQVAFLIRAERNEVLPGEGPRVVLEKISIHPSNQKTCGSPSILPEAKVVLERLPQKKVKERILQHMKHQFSLPGTNHEETVHRVQESCTHHSDQDSSSSSTLLSNSSNMQAVQRKKTQLVNKDLNGAPSGSKAHAIMSVVSSSSNSQKKTAIVGPKSRELAQETVSSRSNSQKKTAIVGPKSRKLAQETKRKRTFSLDPSDIEEIDTTSKIFKPRDYSSLKVVSPISTKVFCKGIGRPVVLLDKLIVPADLKLTFHVQGNDSPESSQCTFREKVNSMINRRVGNKTTPSWVIPLVETVCDNNALSEKEKLDKILQVDNLLKAELEGTSNMIPVVKLDRLDS